MLLGLIGLAAVAGGIVLPRAVPVPPWWDEDPRAPSLTLLDRDGGRIAQVRRDGYVRGGAIALAGLPAHVTGATLAAEDRRFYRHPGVDPLAVARSARDCVARAGRGGLRGASTLTMQAVRLRRGAPSGMAGRVAEVFWSLVVERHRSKREILERYLATAPYGAQVYGIEEGARRWFGVSPTFLSPAQAALLAAIPRNPSRLDPVRHPGAARAARDAVLRRMARAGFLDAGTVLEAEASPLGVRGVTPRVAPHFADWVVREIAGDNCAVVVRTTLDPCVQRWAEQSLRAEVEELSTARAGGGAVVVLDNRRSEVLAMVGSPAYDGADAGQFNAALALRQPGSAVKPFTYVTAFSGRLRPSSILGDVPVTYGDREGVFAPRNYAGGHAGPVSARVALANSWNVPAVEALRTAGLRETARTFATLGLFPDGDAERVGLGLTLGAAEVSPLDLACAYASLARGGVVLPARAVLEARDARGGRLPLRAAEPVRALDPVSCHWVLAILADPAARATAFGRGGPLETGYPCAAKTGTSSDWRDAWAVFTTPRYTIAVWMGDPAGRPMDEVTGARGPAVVARRIMDRLVAGASPEDFPVPDGIERRLVCAVSGRAAGAHCAQAEWDEFRATDPPLEGCNVHVTRIIDRATGLLARDCTPRERRREAVYVVWPDRFALHAPARGGPPSACTACACGRPDCGPLGDARRAVAGARPRLAILHPADGSCFAMDPTLPAAQQRLALEAEAPGGETLAWSVDGVAIGSTSALHRIFWPLSPGEHVITVAGGGGARHECRIEVLGAVTAASLTAGVR